MSDEKIFPWWRGDAERVDFALARLHIELFTASNVLRGDQLRRFQTMIEDLGEHLSMLHGPAAYPDDVPHNAETAE